MSHGELDEHTAGKRNVARYFTEHRSVGWLLLAVVLVAGIFGYVGMPKRKDPFIKVRTAVVICAWPGVGSDKIEDLITKKIEEKVAQNTDVDRIESTSRTGVSVVTVNLRDSLPVDAIPKAFDDIDLKLRTIRDLPPGASPIEFQKDFGDTAALMLTIASPKARDPEIVLRAREVSMALAAERSGLDKDTNLAGRRALILSYPLTFDTAPLRQVLRRFVSFARASGRVNDIETLEGSGFFGVDGDVHQADTWVGLIHEFRKDEVSTYLHPELWPPIVIEKPEDAYAALKANAGEAYTYRELDQFTDHIAKHLRGLSMMAKVSRAGVINERIFLDYSQERFAALGVGPSTLRDALALRGVQAPGGAMDAYGRTLAIQANDDFRTTKDIGDSEVTMAASGSPVYVRDVVDVSRDYESPPLFLNFYTSRNAAGEFTRDRAITLSMQMRAGEQIAAFSTQVDAALKDVLRTIPEDVIVARTSDQAQQVEEKVGLFMTSLYEAIAIIVLVGFVGFGEWRSALLLALSIPLTLAMTFVFMAMLGIDIQQMSIAALILALGLLVDDPVVAGDAIKHELDAGKPRLVAAWLGPTKLGRAILFATITNIVAYLPFLLISGDVGHFIYSLPIVMTCSLVASRIVSMTFIPLLGWALLRASTKPKKDENIGFLGAYRRAIRWSIDHRYRVLGLSTIVLVAGGLAGSRLRSSFFPQDHAHLFYIDINLPEDATIRATREAAEDTDAIVREVAERYGQEEHKTHPIVHSVTTFVGGGAPRFWYSLGPQQRAQNYAQLVVEVEDEHDTTELITPFQTALTTRVAGARIDVRKLENGKPVPRPVDIRFSGESAEVLRRAADQAKAILRSVPIAERVRDDWGEGSFRVTLAVDEEKAARAGVSDLDIAATAAAGYGGVPLATLREGDHAIPIVARLRADERGNAGNVEELYVFGTHGQKVPLGQVAHVDFQYALEKIQRRNQRRTISVSCFPAADRLPSEVMKLARPALLDLQKQLPPGYQMEIGGTEENVLKVRKESGIVAVVSMLGILLTLVFQFRSALKPVLVFAAIPYGICGSLIAIVAMGSPFGFTAILGVISLVGVIVSHVIVLFDYVEEAAEHGEPLEQALLGAGTQRLRPVLITVGATVLGLVPLAVHGGPLWEPLCYAQIGGLILATGVTLVLVPVLYAVAVLDLKWIVWSKPGPSPAEVRHMLGLRPDHSFAQMALDSVTKIFVKRRKS